MVGHDVIKIVDDVTRPCAPLPEQDGLTVHLPCLGSTLYPKDSKVTENNHDLLGSSIKHPRPRDDPPVGPWYRIEDVYTARL